MISKIEINKVRKRLEWLPEYFYNTLFEVDMDLAETNDHRRKLDLSGLEFSPINLGDLWGSQWGSGWFRGSYTIDTKSIQGSKVLLKVDTGGESIVYIDGKATAAIDLQHDEIPLSQDELTHGNHEVLIESYAGHHIPSVEPKPVELIKGRWTQPKYQHTRIVLRNEDAWGLYYDISTLLQVADELDQDSMRKAHIYKNLSDAVDLIIWDTENLVKRNSQFKQARQLIAPLLKLKNSPTTPTLNIMGHAHIDIAWLWPLAETIRKCGRTFATQLRMMEEYPFYKFFQSQPQSYEFTEEHYPELFERIRQAIKDGKWEANGGMWVESDTNVPSAEALIRQLLVGKAYFLEKFGVDSEFLWLPDVFGYNGNLPQILKGCGVEYFITSKIGWNQTNRFPYDIFTWKGIDDTEILATYIKNTYNSMTDPKSAWRSWKEFNEKHLVDTIVDSVGHGDGGGGITMEHLEYAKRLEDLEGAPKLKFGYISDIMKKLDENREEYPQWMGELYLELHRGTLTTQSWTKRNNRKCEYLFRDAELFASIDYFMNGSTYPQDVLLDSWKKFLTNQFHDILPGSSITRVYDDCDKIYGEIAKDLTLIVDESIQSIVGAIPNGDNCCRKDQEDQRQLVVINTLNWDRRDRVSLPLESMDELWSKIGNFTPEVSSLSNGKGISIVDSEGNSLPCQVSGDKFVFMPGDTIPGMGYKFFGIQDKGPDYSGLDENCSVKANSRLLENRYIKVDINEHGQLTSVYDKEEDREVIMPGKAGNSLIIAEDLPLNWDAWDIDKFYHKTSQVVKGSEKIEVISAGPIEARIRVTREIGSSSMLTQDIVLGCESKRIDFETKVDWKETHKLLKVAFDVDVLAQDVNYEIQGGYLSRPAHDNTTWDQAKFEVCGHKWADLSEEGYGAALLNDCKYAYECIGNQIRLTLLKSPVGPDPVADKGEHVFTYSFLPHKGRLVQGEVPLRANELNVPYRVQVTSGNNCKLPDSQQYVKVQGGQIFLQSVKKAEKGDGAILRFSEMAGERKKVKVSFHTNISKFYETNMLEENEKIIGSNGDTVTLNFRPFEIKTIKLVF